MGSYISAKKKRRNDRKMKFVTVSKWKPQNEIVIMKERVAAWNAFWEGKWAKDANLLFSYDFAQGVYGVWEAPNLEALEKATDQFLPTLKKYTEFVPVVQSSPPTQEYVVGCWQQWIKAASK